MAVDMALSLREWHDEPLAIAVDAALEAYIAERYPAVFDKVVRLPVAVPTGWACKLAIAEVSPFARTVFIDADTIVIGPLGALLADAERTDFAMMGEYVASPTDERHNGVSMQALMRQFGLQRYFHNHSGAFTFERDYGRRFLAECMEVWSTALSSASRASFEQGGDELVFGIVAARRGMAAIREPFPMYWWEQLEDPLPHRPKPLCHLHARPPHRTMKWLMVEAAQRRCRAGLPSASIEHWLRKTSRKAPDAGWPTTLKNWDVRLRVPLAAHRDRLRHVQPAVDADAGTRDRVGSRARASGSERRRTGSNLLLHPACRRQPTGTPHLELAICECSEPDAGAPVVLAVHCWPIAPKGLRVVVGWHERERQPILEIELQGPLPDHPGAVVALRLRGLQAKALDAGAPLRARLRSSLLSGGVLQNSVLTVGIAGEYLASTTVDRAIAMVDQELLLPGRQWPAPHDELFVELRVAVAGLAHSGTTRIELSRFYLGQDADGRRAGDLPSMEGFAS
jgi:hypothetical protein